MTGCFVAAEWSELAEYITHYRCLSTVWTRLFLSKIAILHVSMEKNYFRNQQMKTPKLTWSVILTKVMLKLILELMVIPTLVWAVWVVDSRLTAPCGGGYSSNVNTTLEFKKPWRTFPQSGLRAIKRMPHVMRIKFFTLKYVRDSQIKAFSKRQYLEILFLSETARSRILTLSLLNF